MKYNINELYYDTDDKVWIAHFKCKYCKEHFIVFDVNDVVNHACFNHKSLISSDPRLVIVNNFDIITDWIKI